MKFEHKIRSALTFLRTIENPSFDVVTVITRAELILQAGENPGEDFLEQLEEVLNEEYAKDDDRE